MNICALSGKILNCPLISKKSGHVFEKELIKKHLEASNQCPITGEYLTQEDLVEVVASSENLVIDPRESPNDNTTQILKKLQSEWDCLLLENFQIKKLLKEMKEEITHNLYQHEAANLVICRLIKERDDIQNRLKMFKSQLLETNKEEESAAEIDEEFDFMGVYDSLVNRINETASGLIEKRRKRVIPTQLKSPEELCHYKVKGSFPIHSSAKPGITCLDVHPYFNNFILSGGIDNKTIIFDINKEAQYYANDKHSKRINSAKFYPSQDILAFCSVSSDCTGTFWIQESNKFYEGYRSAVHKAPVTSCSFHPLKDYCLYTSRDSFWSFHNLVKGVCLTKQQTETEKEICKSDFHPDGMIFATGENNGLIRIWDITSQNAAATIEAFSTEVSGLSFSENGYYLAVSAIKDSIVKIIDLRKSEVIRKIELPEKNEEVRSVKFDFSGSYLGIVGSKVHLYNVKKNTIFSEFNEHTDLITDIAFGKNCDFFVTSSLDRNIKLFS